MKHVLWVLVPLFIVFRRVKLLKLFNDLLVHNNLIEICIKDAVFCLQLLDFLFFGQAEIAN